MPHVPRRTAPRASHQFHERATHGPSGFESSLVAHQEADRQQAADGVNNPGDIRPGSVGTGAFASDAAAPNVLNGPATVTVDDTGLTIADGALTFLDSYGSTALTGGGFGSAWRRFLMNGMYNADFFAQPATPANNISASNPLPYWAWTDASGTAITAKNVAESTSGSGRKLEFAMAAGAAGDYGYLQQIVPVNGSKAQSFSYAVGMSGSLTTAPTATADYYLEAQYLKNDGTTTTGSAASSQNRVNGAAGPSAGLHEWIVAPNGGVLPSDAYYLRVRVGMKRNSGAATSATESSVPVYEVRVIASQARVYLADEPAAWPGTPGAAPYLASLSGRLTSSQPYSWPAGASQYACDTTLTVTTTPTDVSGCTVTFTPATAETVLVWGVADIQCGTAGTHNTVVSLLVDGAGQSNQIIGTGKVVSRGTYFQFWVVGLSANSSHTLKLQASKTVNDGASSVVLGHTTLTILRMG